MGIALGCMGMSMDDFCRCTPSEFAQVWSAWNGMERGAWERMRMECIASLQPYSRKTLRPADVMPLPWDVDKEDEKRNEDEELTREELLSRMEEVKKRYGLR